MKNKLHILGMFGKTKIEENISPDHLFSIIEEQLEKGGDHVIITVVKVIDGISVIVSEKKEKI
jgi:hypothetical protein